MLAAFAGCGGNGSPQYLCDDPNDPNSCSPYTPPTPQVTTIPVPVLPPGCSNYQAELLYPVRGQVPTAEYAGTMYVEFFGRLPDAYLAVEVLRRDAADVVTDEMGTALQRVNGALPAYVPSAQTTATVYASTNLSLASAVAFDVRLADDRFPPVCPSQDLGGLLPQSVVRSTTT
ncbi:MAG TPA: hypothetical protein VMA36_18420 [Candidatus Limnocylindria bacterium]|nr:hypothetical protein [Candidatus Limnocylindria bacterium]